MKCDKCNQEIEGVYVGPGDKFKCEKTGYSFRVIGQYGEPKNLFAERFLGEYMAIFFDGCEEYVTLDGRPVLGFRDPRDERIKELEAELAEARKDAALNVFMTANELRQLNWVKLDDEAIKKLAQQIVNSFRDSLVIRSGVFGTAQFEYSDLTVRNVAQQIRDFRDGRL